MGGVLESSAVASLIGKISSKRTSPHLSFCVFTGVFLSGKGMIMLEDLTFHSLYVKPSRIYLEERHAQGTLQGASTVAPRMVSIAQRMDGGNKLVVF